MNVRIRMHLCLQEECKSPSQCIGTIAFPQKAQRKHRKQTPMPETQLQLPPAQGNKR